MTTPATSFLSPIRNNLIRIFMLLATTDELMTGKEIAKKLDISISSVEIYMRIVKDSEYIKGMRGTSGGYTLTGNPKDITVIDIIGKTITTSWDEYPLAILTERTVEYLDGITLQALLDWDE